MITSGNDTALLNKPQGWSSLYKFLIIRHIEIVSIVHYLLLLYNIRFFVLSIMCHTQVTMHTLKQSYVNLGFICAYKNGSDKIVCQTHGIISLCSALTFWNGIGKRLKFVKQIHFAGMSVPSEYPYMPLRYVNEILLQISPDRSSIFFQNSNLCFAKSINNACKYHTHTHINEHKRAVQTESTIRMHCERHAE